MASTSRDITARQFENISESSEFTDSEDEFSDAVVDDRATADAIAHAVDECEDTFSNTRKQNISWKNMESYRGSREQFSEICGPRNEAVNVTDIVSIFQLFFTEDFVKYIADETNRYAEDYLRRNVLARRYWAPVSVNELYVYLALLMGIVNKPTLKSYFSTKEILSTPIFSKMISRDRFQAICKFLHFIDNSTQSNYQGPARLFKIFPVIQHLNRKFQMLYYPGQDISIDESLTLWKERLAFKQYLPLKVAKFGIKTYELYEAKTGYLWNFLVYSGSDVHLNSKFITPTTNKTMAIVLYLSESILNRGHTLWMDNYYNSPYLAKLLKSQRTDCVGTLRSSGKDVPQCIKDKKLKKGDIISVHDDDVVVMKWQDKKAVIMISTYHSNDTQTIDKRGKKTIKPTIVIDYNDKMGGVDLKNQMLHPYLVQRRMLKWYHKLFRRLLNTSVLNCMIIYNKNKQGRAIEHLQFRVILIENLLRMYADKQRSVLTLSDNSIARLTERHFISKLPTTEAKTRHQRRCVVCTKRGRKKETVYWCRNCDVGLCLQNCFEIYHTKLDY